MARFKFASTMRGLLDDGTVGFAINGRAFESGADNVLICRRARGGKKIGAEDLPNVETAHRPGKRDRHDVIRVRPHMAVIEVSDNDTLALAIFRGSKHLDGAPRFEEIRG